MTKVIKSDKKPIIEFNSSLQDKEWRIERLNYHRNLLEHKQQEQLPELVRDITSIIARKGLGFNDLSTWVGLLKEYEKITGQVPKWSVLLREGIIGRKERNQEKIIAFSQAVNESDYLTGTLNEAFFLNQEVNYYVQREPQKAFLLNQKILAIRPESQSAWRNMAKIHAKLKQHEKAIDWYKKINNERAEESEYLWLNIGDEYAALNRVDLAIEAYQKALAISPDLSEVWQKMSSFYIKIGREKECENYLEKHVLIKEQYEFDKDGYKTKDKWRSLGRVYRALGNFKKELACYETVLALDVKHEFMLFDTAECCERIGLNNKALEYYKKLVEQHRDDQRPFERISLIYAKEGRQKEGVAFFKNTIEVQNQNSNDWHNLALAYRNLGKIDETLKALQKTTETQPSDSWSWNNIGLMYKDLKEHEQSISCFQEAISLQPDNDNFRYNLALAYQKSGLVKQALGAIQEAAQSQSNSSWFWSRIGLLYHDLKQSEESISCFQRAVSIKPDDDISWYHLGMVYSASRQFKKAMECYQKSLELVPNDSMALNSLGLVYKNLGENQKALNCYKRILEFEPTEVNALNNLGNLYSRKGQLEKALECYEKAIHAHPDRPLTWNNVGWMSLKVHQLEKAMNALEKAWGLSNHTMNTVPINLGHVYLLHNDLVTALAWYKKSIPLYESMEAFLKDMEGDYAYLKMETKGVSRKTFDALLMKLH